MALLPVPEELVPIVWQNTVVDIEATSRYGEPGRTPDTASVNTTMLLDAPEARELTLLAPGHYEAEASLRVLGTDEGMRGELVTADDDRFDGLVGRLTALRDELGSDRSATDAVLAKVKRFHCFRLPIPKGNSVLRFFTRLQIIREDDGSYEFSAIYPAEFTQLVKGGEFTVVALAPKPADLPVKFDVELVSWSKVANPQVFGLYDLPRVAGRYAVSWQWRQDPELKIGYLYSS